MKHRVKDKYENIQSVFKQPSKQRLDIWMLNLYVVPESEKKKRNQRETLFKTKRHFLLSNG